MIPHIYELSTSITAFAGLLNHHASQLQQLTGRVEVMNEWINLDEIVMARMSADDDKSMGGKGETRKRI